MDCEGRLVMSIDFRYDEKLSRGLAVLAFALVMVVAAMALGPAMQPETALAAQDGQALTAGTVKSGIATQEYCPEWIDDDDDESPGTPMPPFVILKEGTAANITLNDDNGHVSWCTFTPTEDGDYSFTSSDSEDAFGALYVGDEHAGAYDPSIEDPDPGYLRIAFDDDGTGTRDFSVKGRNLRAGWTYYLACSNADDDDDSYTVSVAKFDDQDLKGARIQNTNALWAGTAASLKILYVRVEVSSYDAEGGEEGWEMLEADKDYQVEGWYSYDEATDTSTKLDAAPSQVGLYFVRIEGISPYHGTRDIEFGIYDFFDLSNWNLEWTKHIYAGTTASSSTLGLCLTDDINMRVDREPVLGTDYEISCWYKQVKNENADGPKYVFESLGKNAPKAAGKYRVEVTGKGDFRGTIGTGFSIIDPTNIDNYRYYYADELLANGTAASLSRLGLVIYRYSNSRVRLTAGTDYDVSAWCEWVSNGQGGSTLKKLTSAPKEPGEYVVRLVGKGSYTGEVELDFDIVKTRELGIGGVIYNEVVPYDGKPLTMAKLGVSIIRKGDGNADVKLVEGTDYTAGPFQIEDDDSDSGWRTMGASEVAPTGEYRVVLTGKGHYEETKTIEFQVTDPADLEFATMSNVDPYYLVNTSISKVKPTVVSLDGKILKEGADYVKEFGKEIEEDGNGTGKFVAVTDLSQAGRYRLTVSAVAGSGYEGENRAYFMVVKTDPRPNISDGFYIDDLKSTYNYTGKAIKPSVSVRSFDDYSVVLKSGSDYYLGYKNNTNLGKATISANGMGGYKGQIVASFIIWPKKGYQFGRGSNNYTVTFPGKELSVTGSKGGKAKVKIPAKVKLGGTTYKVTSIAAGAFKNNKKLKSLVIGPNVKKVGKNALKGTKLKTIIVKSGKLTKRAAKNLIKGSKVRTVKLKGKAARAKKAKYQKYFGKKVTVK